jgi:hypothetical protein
MYELMVLSRKVTPSTHILSRVWKGWQVPLVADYLDSQPTYRLTCMSVTLCNTTLCQILKTYVIKLASQLNCVQLI